MSNNNYKTRPAYDARKKKKNIPKKLIFVLLIIVIAVIAISNATATKKYYLKDIKVASASIRTKAIEDGKYYIQISSRPDLNIADDDLWIEVTSAYYYKHNNLDQVGVLFGNYDIYKEKLIGSKMALEKSVWTFDEIYDSLEDGKSKNPYRKYNAPASIEKKKAFESGNYYFKLKNEERIFTLKVSKSVYEKYKEKQEIECKFEGYGDFVKLISLAE
ncbi:hypothetical protein [Pseudobacteroides cellulosolvens]|uniref:Uncharacterized protein n=1 Tax=Pseudobacteroides cellulosolvens ATCC 35603 = DSM 2933 TaxID=398512 RepID=A0A0L6JJN0_9FIRM|nr:hypothetical protein [Pseudobacteroides cellulosolvens]KNY26086.1 hypothetical protein Bccel_1348 [Pseudobacteroides cellulosolvens ATCC 35603 = DSM 2933]